MQLKGAKINQTGYLDSIRAVDYYLIK